MRLPYRIPESDEETIALASKIVELIISSGLSYRQASAALEKAQEVLLSTTKPINLAFPQ